MLTDHKRVEPLKWPIAPHVHNLKTSVIREILKYSSKAEVISFAGGLPAQELFPLEQLKEVSAQVIDKYGAASVQYSISRGIAPLRELLAQRATDSGAKTEPENVLITSGSQQGIELLARAFVDPGDFIITENPTYVGALQAFNYYRSRYVTIEMDNEGMLVDRIADKIKQYNPKLIYTISNFQNPTGRTMSASRRIQLAEIASVYDIPVVDDNPYGDVRFEGETLSTLKALGGEGVIALRTFSKIVAPGLRIGWMNGPKTIIDQFEKVKQCADLHTSTFNQYLIYEFMAQGLLEPHIVKIKADYLNKRNVMLKAMEENFPEEVTWTHPQGGLFLWVTLPTHMSATELFPKAIDLNVAYVPGQPFFPHAEGDNTLRLNYSFSTPDEIEEGIKRLAKLFKENM